MDYSTLTQFCEGWMEMVSKNNPSNGLDKCFYHFFASFVIYNCIYNFCYKDEKEKNKMLSSQMLQQVPQTPKQNKDKKKTEGDRYRAICFMTEYAYKNNFINNILENSRDDISTIKSLWLSNAFYVLNKDDNGEICEQERKLKQTLSSSNDDSEIFRTILELIYKVRCNMFHGDKEHTHNQITILNPLCRILDNINSIVLEKLHKDYEMENS